MRKLFIAGNWKMNTNREEAVALARGVAQGADGVDVDLAVMPPFVYLPAVVDAAAGSAVAVGAQNMHFESKGAFTGEISPDMLKDIWCTCVILGHSERRHVFGEDDALINRKLLVALDAGLKPILCIGETLEEREAEKTLEVCERHVREGLKDVAKENFERVTIAYEPVWAIGTGKVATPDQAQEVHAMVRKLLGELAGGEIAEKMRIQYGGSVKPENAADILSQPDVDGALVGGASLKAESFLAIAQAGAEAAKQ